MNVNKKKLADIFGVDVRTITAWQSQGVLPLEGTETALTYYKSGTFATEAIHWPESVDEHKKANAFAGSALSHAALP
ncbi:hypothetical protein CVD20_14660 [Escherichia coli]|nr:hypothetical protein CVD17_01450 [Escherichia coli]PJF61571.1 hypothetical protein CVD20_14660 [Escherichia coli]PJF66157.1 hypothetical protein CVD22_15495 [Escherichia coli]PJF69035.1 hypothetical protein CVD24_25580 [Escherichia coli]PJG09587.1 hypothetical protein CVE10_05590 [Escherichia coli]